MKTLLTYGLTFLAAFFCLDARSQVSTAPTGPVTYLQTDLTGNIILATDASGNTVWDERYLPYGAKRLGASGGVGGVDSSSQKYGYQDRALDPETGLQYVGARYYDPLTGRFDGMDPALSTTADIYTFNRYAYANGNPYRYTDPSGKIGIDIVFVAYDLYTLAAEGATTTNLIALGLDTASTFGLGFGAGAAYRIARVTYRVAETGKAVDVAAHAAEAATRGGEAAAGAAETVGHHTIPKAIQKQLPPAVRSHPDVVGRAGNPNVRQIPEARHGEIHSSAPGEYYPGGQYTRRFDELIRERGGYDAVSPRDINEIRDQLVREFQL